MSKAYYTPIRLRKAAFEAIRDALGPTGLIRFLQMYEPGSGDYTKERSQWLKNDSVELIVSRIKSRRKER